MSKRRTSPRRDEASAVDERRESQDPKANGKEPAPAPAPAKEAPHHRLAWYQAKDRLQQKELAEEWITRVEAAIYQAAMSMGQVGLGATVKARITVDYISGTVVQSQETGRWDHEEDELGAAVSAARRLLSR